MNHWSESSLGNICELYQPKTISSAELVEDGLFPVYGANGVIGKYDKFNHEESQLLITCRGATCGAVNISQPNSWINGNAMVVRPKNGDIEVGFLKHLFLGGLDLSAVITGAAQPQITRQSLAPLRIRFPNPPEQRRLISILDQADALRAKRREALAQLDSLTHSIFIEMFGDPVTNPLGWQTEVLDGVASFFAGNSLPEGEPFIDQKDGFFLMKVSDMNLPGNERTIVRCQSWSSETGARSATCPAGTIVIPKRGGAIGTNKKRLTTRQTVLDPNVMGIHPKSGVIEREYLFQWFLRFDLSSIASGSSVPQLNKQDLVPLKIQVPPLSNQQIFATRIQAVELLKDSHNAALVNLDELFTSLQHRAFRGEL